jgi:cell division protease FtsH
LLARAVAGEAEVPYFSVNGSEFIQMFVGVGASRVRDLFATAKAQAPAIIFIDEIDAVGRQRGAGLGGGHDEREQTLNQILGEMDGFQANDSVIILAATNRPDILDPALLRPGRFDRHVTVSRPTKTGRLAIFKVHVRDVPLAPDVDLEVMAQATAGMTGADIQNLVNEAALWAARHDKTKVEMEDFYYAHDKVLMGAKREEILTEKEKERTAYHEAGHTMAAWNLKGANPVHKVTIIPRGQALGVTQMVPDEDRMNLAESEIDDHLVVLLAGRAAESLIYDELTVGAENDLERATSMARRMVTHWGMSEKLGPVSYKMSDEDPFLGGQMHKARQFSEHTMEVIDEEVHKILQAASEKALELLKENKHALESLTKGLIEAEELDRHEIEKLIGPSVHKEKESLLQPNTNVIAPDSPPTISGNAEATS